MNEPGKRPRFWLGLTDTCISRCACFPEFTAQRSRCSNPPRQEWPQQKGKAPSEHRTNPNFSASPWRGQKAAKASSDRVFIKRLGAEAGMCYERGTVDGCSCKVSIQATGISVLQVSTTLQGFQRQMKNRPQGQKRKSRFVDPACEFIYIVRDGTLVTPSMFADDRGRYCGQDSRPKTNPWKSVQKVCSVSQTTKTRRKNISCISNRKHVLHKQAHVMSVKHLWCVIVSLHCRHNQIATKFTFPQLRTVKLSGSTEINTQLTLSTDTREPGIKTGTLSIKRYKTVLSCTLYDFREGSLSWMDANILHVCCF